LVPGALVLVVANAMPATQKDLGSPTGVCFAAAPARAAALR
jgi:hypothetical protein